MHGKLGSLSISLGHHQASQQAILPATMRTELRRRFRLVIGLSCWLTLLR